MRAVLFVCLFFLSVFPACTPETSSTRQTALVIYRFTPPAFLEFSEDFQPVREIPFSIPTNCGLYGTFPAPTGRLILIELNCPNGQTVLFLDTDTGSASQPVTESDAHFLAWTSDGEAAYLKIDTLGSPQIIRADSGGKQDFIPITEFTYDLAPKPASGDFTFTFSRGLGQGSELWLATRGGKIVEQLYADPYNYISYARFSPDGRQIAFITIPDIQTPFTVGELWVMDSDGSNARKLTDADAGHGYAANWSPDGTKIAFVMRENPENEAANQSSEALMSNIYLIDVISEAVTQISKLTEGHAATPHWSPDGNTLAFDVVVNGRMEVHIADIDSGETRPLVTESACCPAWMRK